MTTIRVTDETPIPLVRDVIEARTRRLMAELSRTPNSWPTRAEHKALRGEVDAALDEWNRLMEKWQGPDLARSDPCGTDTIVSAVEHGKGNR